MVHKESSFNQHVSHNDDSLINVCDNSIEGEKQIKTKKMKNPLCVN